MCFFLFIELSFHPFLSDSSKHIAFTAGFQKFQISCNSRATSQNIMEGDENDNDENMENPFHSCLLGPQNL